jgi:predicted dinucleotide-binding enzyme
MRIGFIGAGRIGGNIARHLVARDHDVALSNSRGPETLAEFVAELGPLASAVTTEEAIAFSELVVVSIPLKAVQELPADLFAGKTVIDTNNYYPERDGQIASIDDGTLTDAEYVASLLPRANVVKAFNAIYFEHLANQAKPAGDPTRRGIPIAGDSAASKLEVEQLIDQIGFDPVDAGELKAGFRFQNGGDLYGKELTAAELREALGLG